MEGTGEGAERSRGHQQGMAIKASKAMGGDRGQRKKHPSRKDWAERECGWMEIKRMEEDKPTWKREKYNVIRFILWLKKIIKKEKFSPNQMKTQRGF